jgi:large subunit ribosomal protein L23
VSGINEGDILTVADSKNIVIKPLITEKATLLRDRHNQYVFQVDPRANRIEIQRAVEKKFNVGVTDVKTITVHGHQRRSIGRYVNKRKAPDWKKAVVTLKAGDTIEVYEGV